MYKTKTTGMSALCLGAVLLGSVFAQESGNRQELERVDLSGAPGMEIVSSISEYQPGDVLGRHSHHGIESGYFVQGGTIQPPGKDPINVPTGAPVMNLRDVVHGGFKVVGDVPIKIYTVHVVDKGKPLYEWVE